ncbi:hypothetical protein ACHAQH_007520 [Verticillium albo-atrum]
MASFSTLYLSGLLLASTANAQLSWYGERDKNAFTYVQPRNTTILGQYGHSEAVFPSPLTKGTGGWDEALRKAQESISELTLEEKSAMVTGEPGPCVGNIVPIPRLDFGGLCLQDGPAGLRAADGVSVYPSGVTIASSWDKDMFYNRSLAMGREFKGKGAHIILA